ncbi:MAG: branched-chain amino acid ABC transporter permease, partial [Acetobacteraceae bacterium]|nr:branched-chain amino acid ABC transporter permease [Acetobacteraceae bacterium]
MSRARSALPPLAGLAAVLAAAPFVLPHLGASLDLLQRVLIIGLLGLGFDLLFGAAGLLSFGQAAF